MEKAWIENNNDKEIFFSVGRILKGSDWTEED
jgi:hypothetical protein